MNITLWGYGKMGKAIEQIAKKRGHSISCIITKENYQIVDWDTLKKTDVVIEFTSPKSAFNNVSSCLKRSIPVVTGTTGWDKQIAEAKQICKDNNTSLVVSFNFSIGVNLFFSFHKWIAKKMAQYSEYAFSIYESHHIQKKDMPSGTAIKTANIALQEFIDKYSWVLAKGQDILPNEIPIYATREKDVIGTHTVKYSSPIDTISLTHQANNREGFALGTVIAAEYICKRKGVFTMETILGL